VATAANGYEEIVIASERNGRNHVGHARTLHDESGASVDHRVEDRTRPVIAVLAATKNAAANSRAKGLGRRMR
jgi:hypothetical protein